MAMPKLIYSQLRRTRTLSGFPYLSPAAVYRHVTGVNSDGNSTPSRPPIHPYRSPRAFPAPNSLYVGRHLHQRALSTLPDESSPFIDDPIAGLTSAPELAGSGLDAEVAKGVVTDVVSSGEESILPVRALISLLDGYHDVTGLPWWIVIASGTLVMRMALFPLLVLQLKKLKTISEFFPKLPPPIPPPLSGRTFTDQISLFRRERKAVGCPSYLWFLASVSVQVPCFLLAVTSIRRMSLDHHPGFECKTDPWGPALLKRSFETSYWTIAFLGGALWFQNLTEFSHGPFGSIFPILISGLHFLNVQLAFDNSSLQKMSGTLGLLAKYYKHYLDFLVLPLLYIGYCIPQGSLVYWVTNSSLSAVQHFILRSPKARAQLGLPQKESPAAAANSTVVAAPETPSLEPPMWQKVIPANLSPVELLAISVKLISGGHTGRAIPLLREALVKDPDYIRALAVLGQTLLQKGEYAEAAQHLERVISKILATGIPTEGEEVDIFILASQWAGIANIEQGKHAEGLVHLERVASMKEPMEPKSKVHYFDGLIILASALYDKGSKAEALTYARLAAAYNPAKYKKFLEMCENKEDNFVIDLVSSRRRDY